MTINQAIQQGRFNSEYHKLAVNLFYTTNWLSNQHSQLLKPFGISMQQYNILRILRGQKGTPVSVNCLIERMLDKSSNASRLVNKLLEKGLVERKICPQDRRQVEVKVTPRGMALLMQIDGPMEKMRNVLSILSEEEASIVNKLLDKLRSSKQQ
ncbi:MAG: MarR family transcriptional regulator [Crocinitomicaceae bacterium]|nr:MarR family transcriptional regulator [Crocinitomicaceae bacterium]